MSPSHISISLEHVNHPPGHHKASACRALSIKAVLSTCLLTKKRSCTALLVKKTHKHSALSIPRCFKSGLCAYVHHGHQGSEGREPLGQGLRHESCQTAPTAYPWDSLQNAWNGNCIGMSMNFGIVAEALHMSFLVMPSLSSLQYQKF